MKHMICPKADECQGKVCGDPQSHNIINHSVPHRHAMSCVVPELKEGIKFGHCPVCVPYKPQPGPQYRSTGKMLTIWEVALHSRITSDELIGLASWAKGFELSPREDLFKADNKFIAYATRSGCFREFLLEGGYIEKVPDEWLLG